MKKPSPLTPLPQSRETGTGTPLTPLPQGRETQTRIFLVGGRGAGKTTTGRALATHLGWAFADVDDEFEREAGKTIAEVFASVGETRFRLLEAAALARLSTATQVVVATGGGVVLFEANRELLKSRGVVVWLGATPEVMYRRMSADPSTPKRRPDLTPIGGLAEVELMLRQREPLYKEVADLMVDTTDLSPDGVVSAILAAC